MYLLFTSEVDWTFILWFLHNRCYPVETFESLITLITYKTVRTGTPKKSVNFFRFRILGPKTVLRFSDFRVQNRVWFYFGFWIQTRYWYFPGSGWKSFFKFSALPVFKTGLQITICFDSLLNSNIKPHGQNIVSS